MVDACSAFQAMTGIITFSSSWPASAAAANRGVTPDHLEADLVDHLGHRRVDLAGHDGRPRLYRGQLNFGNAGARAHAEEAEVGGDLPDFDGEAPQGA